MKALIQRVTKASVRVEKKIVGQINNGLLILVGFETLDDSVDYDWIIRKSLNMRIFNDKNDIMNLSLLDTNGELLIVSQFTLHASTKKGNRPSYSYSSKPELAKKQYEDFLKSLNQNFNGKVETGIFGAHMQVELLNNGPVTIMLDSKNKI